MAARTAITACSRRSQISSLLLTDYLIWDSSIDREPLHDFVQRPLVFVRKAAFETESVHQIATVRINLPIRANASAL